MLKKKKKSSLIQFGHIKFACYLEKRYFPGKSQDFVLNFVFLFSDITHSVSKWMFDGY